MRPWIRRSHIILAIGGSFTGLAITGQSFFTGQGAPILYYAILLSFVALYAYGILAGLRFSENEENKKSLIIFYWWQVPWVSSPIIAYKFTSGFQLSGGWFDSDVSFFTRLGSDWNFSLFQELPWGIGLNAFALTMAIILMKSNETKTPHVEPDNGING